MDSLVVGIVLESRSRFVCKSRKRKVMIEKIIEKIIFQRRRNLGENIVKISWKSDERERKKTKYLQ